MRQSNRTPLTHPLRRILFLCLGLMIMAFGVAFSIKAGLGTSPISSVPYVTSEISGLSVGATTIIMNFLFVLIQIAILRRNYDWFQILQFPAAILFGLTIDLAEWIIAPLPCSGYLMAWGYCALGIVLIAFGVSVEVMANLGGLRELGRPVLLGASRKSVIGLTLDVPVTERLEGTLVTTVFAVLSGCSHVRVHDVKENVRAVRMAEAIAEYER